MDLKEQLEGLKSDLMEGFEKKSQLDIQDALLRIRGGKGGRK